MCVSANERYCPTPPHPSVASRMCGSCRRTCSGVASRMCGSCRRTGSGVASRMCVSANERYCPTPPHPIKIYVFCWTVKSPSAHSRLHTDAFTQTLLHRDSFTHTHKHFYTQTFSHTATSTRGSRERVATGPSKLAKKNAVFDTRTSFGAKGSPPDKPNCKKPSVFDTRTSFRAKEGCCGHCYSLFDT